MTLRLGFIGIVTTDLPASLAFYRALGVGVPDGLDAAPHVDVTLDDGTVLAWDTVETIRSFDPGYTPGTGGHKVALAFDLGAPEAVDALIADLRDAGYPPHVEPWDAPWGQRYASVLDPDGTSIDLFAMLAAS